MLVCGCSVSTMHRVARTPAALSHTNPSNASTSCTPKLTQGNVHNHQLLLRQLVASSNPPLASVVVYCDEDYKSIYTRISSLLTQTQTKKESTVSLEGPSVCTRHADASTLCSHSSTGCSYECSMHHARAHQRMYVRHILIPNLRFGLLAIHSGSWQVGDVIDNLN